MAFATQIQDLVGGTLDQSACDQWAADACKEIINVLPEKLKIKCAAATTLSNSPSVMDMDAVGEILHVTRLSANSGGYQVPCREIPSMYGGLATDEEDLNYYGTATDPVYWIDGNTSDAATLYVKPTPTAQQTSIVHHISYPTVDVSAVSIIANFPDEAEYLVVLYTAIKQLQQYMNLKDNDLPEFIAPTKPSLPTLSAQTLSSGNLYGSADVPEYTKPVMESRVAFSSYTSGLSETDPGTFSLTAVSPIVPTLSNTSISFSGTAPTFTKPSIAPDFAQVNTYIDTNEDIELASAKLQEITTQLNEYSANIQNEQIEFNKENIEYQAQLQISIQNAQFDNQEDARKLQKYQSELTSYQADINKQVQEYSQKLSQYQLELNTSFQAWSKTESDSLQKYQLDMQNALNEFNKDNTSFQANIQEAIQEVGLSDQNEARKLQKYQAESQQYATEINTSVQDFTLNLQKHTTKYQWYETQYVKLKGDYQQGLQFLISGGIPQQQQGR